ncbi:uncharacterized protein LOC6562382 [Drosophila grimshawi]|uniref:GH10798 n=1 Tax=Drosophila grimshawi TaxID=7222 RepID=B4JB11_DROGR|nr:uncharacterized protein LOC6562382 [Drosophila grimshawi]EDW02881.1 GH10798 [Drosophila grimshawi]
MFLNYLIQCLALLLLLQSVSAEEYEFIPGRCEDYPGVESQIGGDLTLCSFPPKYEMPDKEDIDAVIKHIKGLLTN